MFTDLVISQSLVDIRFIEIFIEIHVRVTLYELKDFEYYKSVISIIRYLMFLLTFSYKISYFHDFR